MELNHLKKTTMLLTLTYISMSDSLHIRSVMTIGAKGHPMRLEPMLDENQHVIQIAIYINE